MTAIRTNLQPSSTGTPIPVAGWGILLGRIVNRCVAGYIARCEREAAGAALRQRHDRELKDIGIERRRLDDSLTEIARERMRLQQGGQAG